MAIIYSIESPSGKKYIGQTKQRLSKRISQHFVSAKNANLTRPLYNAIRKYAREDFKIEILEECPNNLLDERESYWIQYYNTMIGGYNLTTGGETAKECSKETKEKMSFAKKGKPSPHKGKSRNYSEETQRKRSESLKKGYENGTRKKRDYSDVSGTNNGNYKTGKYLGEYARYKKKKNT